MPSLMLTLCAHYGSSNSYVYFQAKKFCIYYFLNKFVFIETLELLIM
jgi:hypothetical protein